MPAPMPILHLTPAEAADFYGECFRQRDPQLAGELKERRVAEALIFALGPEDGESVYARYREGGVRFDVRADFSERWGDDDEVPQLPPPTLNTL